MTRGGTRIAAGHRAMFDTGAATHAGRVRVRNEDSFIVRPDAGVWAVADGMGGHEAGDLASRTVVEALQLIERQPSPSALLSECEDRLALANAHLNRIGRERGGIVIGTTLAMLLIHGRSFACVWCGDSRVYLLRGGGIRALSRDHTVLQELVGSGALGADEARAWAGRHVITRAVGVAETLECDMENGVLEADDAFVLCSDGLTEHATDQEILGQVMAHGAQAACDSLVALALERGGIDNVTVIVVRHQTSDLANAPHRARGS
jgi:serine/threonine protein phosphatase PrpC